MRFLKRTQVVACLLLLLAPATILTTAFLAIPSPYVRVRAEPCPDLSPGEFTAYLSASTIPEGTPSVTVSGIETCVEPHTTIGIVLYPGGCPPSTGSIPGIIYTQTDDSSHYSVDVPTSSLSAGSYCVDVGSTRGTGVGQAYLPLTVTAGRTDVYTWTPTYTATTFTDTYGPPTYTTGPPSGPYFDFSLALSPSSLSVMQGGTANYQILVTYSNPAYYGATITVVDVAGLGPGIRYRIIPSPAGLRISTSSSTPAGTYNIVLTGSAMGVMRQASAVLQVQAAEQPFDFSISVSPLDRITTPGVSVTYTVTVNLVAGTAQAVALSVPDAPAGVSVASSQTSGSPPFTSTLTVSVSQSASPGKYPLTVTGIGGGKSRTAPVALIVVASPNFRVEASPASQTVLQGQTASFAVQVVGLNGFSSQVSLMVSGLPAGVSGVFSVPSGAPDFAGTLTVTIPSNSPTGSFTLTITGSGNGLNRIANVVLTVNPTTQTQSSQSTQAGGGIHAKWSSRLHSTE